MPIARADVKFGLYTDFLDRTLSAEDERLPGESIEDGVIRVHDALERAAAILKKRVQGNGQVPPQQTGPAVIETIDYKKWDQFEIDIENAQTPEELEALIRGVDTFPGRLLSTINAKRQSFKK